MSLILDALRKMELERKAKRQSSQEIRAEVLHYRGTDATPGKSRLVPLTAASLLFAATAACYLYFTGPTPPGKETVKTVVVVAPEQLPVMPPPVQLPQQERLLPKTTPLAVKSPVKVHKPVEDIAPPPQKTAETGLTVSGIAWQEERYLRRAVINGLLVGEGGEIQGAKVVEIRENRVRFSRGGEVFEVDHSSAAKR